jgi:putative redox protein
MTSSIIYQGNLRCQATHLQSGTIIETDAPIDNKGKGERFSPTDLLCVSLATCMVTTMGIKAADMDIDLSDTKMEITKHMLSDPRRIGKIVIKLIFPAALKLTEKDFTILTRVADTCPVKKSLHPDLVVEVEYVQ